MIIPLLAIVLLSALIAYFVSKSQRWRIYRVVRRHTFGLGWLAVLLISVAISILSYVIMPKPKAPKPDAAKELDDPVAEAGKPVAVVAGTMRCTELNVLWSGDKSIRTYEVDA